MAWPVIDWELVKVAASVIFWLCCGLLVVHTWVLTRQRNDADHVKDIAEHEKRITHLEDWRASASEYGRRVQVLEQRIDHASSKGSAQLGEFSKQLIDIGLMMMEIKTEVKNGAKERARFEREHHDIWRAIERDPNTRERRSD